MSSLAEFSATTLTGQHQDLSEHLGSVVLVVNTASRCGLTPQYEGLQALHERFFDQGLHILGFPCDQFGHQEPGTAEEIGEFCRANYGVSFPMFAKIEVNGEGAHPLYKWLTGAHVVPDTEQSPTEQSPAEQNPAEQSPAEDSPVEEIPAGDIEWNFAKFLLGRDGRVLRRWSPQVTPEEIQDDIAAALADSTTTDGVSQV